MRSAHWRGGGTHSPPIPRTAATAGGPVFCCCRLDPSDLHRSAQRTYNRGVFAWWRPGEEGQESLVSCWAGRSRSTTAACGFSLLGQLSHASFFSVPSLWASPWAETMHAPCLPLAGGGALALSPLARAQETTVAGPASSPVGECLLLQDALSVGNQEWRGTMLSGQHRPLLSETEHTEDTSVTPS